MRARLCNPDVALPILEREVEGAAVARQVLAIRGPSRIVEADQLSNPAARFEESEVVKVLLENRAGELAVVARKLAEAGVNLRAIYMTGIVDDLVELAVVSDNPKKAKHIWE